MVGAASRYVDTHIMSESKLAKLLAEANELLAIFAASQYTARSRRTH
jgi:hypothetical protein